MHNIRLSRQTQSGNTSLIIVLIIVMIALLGVTGYFVYATNHNNAPLTSTTVGTSSQLSPKSSATNPSAVQPAPQYLDITQWGVKLPLSSTISDAYYVVSVSSVQPDGVPDMVLLGLRSLNSSTCYASGPNTGKNTSIGALSRALTTQTDPVSGALVSQKDPYGTVIGSYYYFLPISSDGVRTNPCATGAALQNIVSAFEVAAEHITAD